MKFSIFRVSDKILTILHWAIGYRTVHLVNESFIVMGPPRLYTLLLILAIIAVDFNKVLGEILLCQKKKCRPTDITNITLLALIPLNILFTLFVHVQTKTSVTLKIYKNIQQVYEALNHDQKILSLEPNVIQKSRLFYVICYIPVLVFQYIFRIKLTNDYTFATLLFFFYIIVDLTILKLFVIIRLVTDALKIINSNLESLNQTKGEVDFRKTSIFFGSQKKSNRFHNCNCDFIIFLANVFEKLNESLALCLKIVTPLVRTKFS